MPDISIDYNTLEDMGKALEQLASDLDGNKARVRNPSVFGALADEVSSFQYAWQSPFNEAVDELKKLARFVTLVADTVFQDDAQLAAGVANQRLQLMMNGHLGRQEMYKTYLETLKQTEGNGGAGDGDSGFDPDAGVWTDENGQRWYTSPSGLTLPLPDTGPNPIADPGDLPTRYTFTEDGSTTTIDVTYNGDKVTSSTTSITDNNGTTYTDTTTYHDNGGYDSTITYANGETETVKVEVSEGGGGTRTVTNSQGTTAWTTNDVKSGEWVKVEKSNGGGGGGGGGGYRGGGSAPKIH